jgi:hypothetical protein
MREKAQVLSEFALKIFAILFMTLDHVGLFLSAYAADGSLQASWGLALQCAGRLAFPLFAFMLAEGMRYTRSREKYLLRLGVVFLAILIAEAILDQTYAQMGLSLRPDAQAFTDLLLEAAFLYFFEKKGPQRWLCLLPLGYILFSTALYVGDQYQLAWCEAYPLYLRSGYNLYGLLLFLGFYYGRNMASFLMRKGLGITVETQEQNPDGTPAYEKTKEFQSLVNSLTVTVLVLVTVLFWGLSYLWAQFVPGTDLKLQTYAILAGLFLFLYNGQRGYSNKYLNYAFYAYYPVHIAVIALVFALIFH